MDTVSTSNKGSERPARWSLRLLGGFELIELSGGGKVELPGKRDRVLIAYLAVSPRGSQPRRKLATLLWGDADDAAALDNLRVCVWSLRKALGDTARRVIARNGEGVGLDPQAFDVDVLTFRRLAAQSNRNELEEAAKLYAGEFLEGLDIESEEFESWRRDEATRCKDQALDVLTRLMMQVSEAGETERAIAEGTRILRLEPLHEAAARNLMRLYGESGRRGTAIQLYHTLAETLKKEFGAQPEAETRAVFAEVSRGGNERAPAPAIATAAKDEMPHPAGIARPSAAPCEPQPAQHFASGTSTPPHVAPQKLRARTFGWIAASGLAAAAMAMFLLRQVAPSTDSASAQRTGVEAAKTVASSTVGVIRVVVLPFVNLSGDSAQEFFSDGITEEITSALARVPNLRVVARTSAFEFKDQRRNIQDIARRLGATHLVEGSVRRAGNQLRITAQLIRADDGLHVWAENYDRNLTDIFATQEDIAQAIAVALRVPLGLQTRESLVSSRTIDPESYQQFLHAKSLLARRARPTQGQGPAQAIAILEELVARNADYAPAWGELALAYLLVPNSRERLPKAVSAAERAIQLNPNLPGGYVAIGTATMERGNFLRADELYSKARTLDPYHPDLLNFTAYFLGAVGRTKEALAVRQQLERMEPFVPAFNANINQLLSLTGDHDRAIERLKTRGNVPDSLADLAQIYSAIGRYGEAADTLMAIAPGDRGPRGGFPAEDVEPAIRLLRAAPRAATPQELPQFSPRFAFVYVAVGAPDRALQRFEEGLQGRGLTLPTMPELWHPGYAPVRRTERFKAFARNAGLVEYWRAKGWPEFCRPLGSDDFACS